MAYQHAPPAAGTTDVEIDGDVVALKISVANRERDDAWSCIHYSRREALMVAAHLVAAVARDGGGWEIAVKGEG